MNYLSSDQTNSPFIKQARQSLKSIFTKSIVCVQNPCQAKVLSWSWTGTFYFGTFFFTLSALYDVNNPVFRSFDKICWISLELYTAADFSSAKKSRMKSETLKLWYLFKILLSIK